MTTDSCFTSDARDWLDRHAPRRAATDVLRPGDSFSTAVFHDLSRDQEAEVLAALQKWNQQRAQRGYHAIAWGEEYGGLGLDTETARAYAALEAEYVTPPAHELFSVTTRLIAPTVAQFGTAEQRADFVAAFLRADVLCCQLFSEPEAGSDLASVATRARQDGDVWLVDGQKVWSSGAQFAEWGLLIARTDPSAAKHAGLTAFLVPMDSPGLEVRPIRQMSGGTSFNEVFFDAVRVPDRLRLGDVGHGWTVALTTLGFERDHSQGDGHVGGTWEQVLATARAHGRSAEPLVRDRLAALYARLRVEGLVNRRAADLGRAGAVPGPEASIGKLVWTENMRAMSDVVSLVVGPALVAGTSQWATHEWRAHVLGAPGYRIAGGSDEIQRNILAERVLGLPR